MRGWGPAVLKILDAGTLVGAQEGADMEKETGVRHVCVSENVSFVAFECRWNTARCGGG